MVPFRTGSRRSNRRRSAEANDDTTRLSWQDERDKYIMTFPIHPLPSMQAPFEESMLDATGETGLAPLPNPGRSFDKRQELLCRDIEASEVDWNPTYNCHWRSHPRSKYHALRKTVAQIVFGVHLLHQHLERSVADVADILLKHVNELDSFLQRANEDLDGSLKDMLFRRKCLKVPMEHVHEFDRLLEDRLYRAQLLDGNVTIERTINRMSALLNDYLADMSTFRDANEELHRFLANIGDGWTFENDDVARIYSAMCGNTAGWSQFLQSLVTKAEKLGVVLVQVSSYCNEIEKRCGAASRRSMIASRSSSRSTNSRDAPRSFRSPAANKPLPMVPNERPPFMSPPPISESASEENARMPRPVPRPSPGGADRLRSASSSDSCKQRGPAMASSVISSHHHSRSEGTVPPRNHGGQGVYHHEMTSSGHDQRAVSHARGGSHGSERPSLSGAESHPKGLRRILLRGDKEEQSPPWTGKDSAYSSVSGGSFAFPHGLPPRSASAMSSTPRAHFGLFPSSGTSTPQHSISGRGGAMSPAFSARQPAEHHVPRPVQRTQTSTEEHSSPSRRLLKKTSFSMLKKLFSRKRHPSVATVAE